MANWTKATLAARVLESLGVVGEGQNATAEQLDRVEETIDSIYKRLRPKHLCPFATSAIPEWAQQPLLKIVAGDAAPKFGYTGPRLQERMSLSRVGMTELSDGAAGNAPPEPITADYM